ncbi:MAG TPA: THUMP domain-containing protein [Bacteroidia bacterium]|nr:THUMP domain-containing protein [Bacteroidia bacterium]
MLLKTDLRIVVSTYAGLEELLAKELRQLGGRDVEIHTRAVSCVGDKGFMYKVNFCSRLALRVMVSLTSFNIKDGDDLYREVAAIDWTEFMKVSQTFAVRCTLNSELFDTNLYPALKVKDAIADSFRSNGGKRPDVEKENPDLEVMVFINRERCTILLNSSGESLHRRGYRAEVDKAPLSEVLAAGIIMLSGWEPHKPLVDFMCGSGTIPIEAALMAANIPPGTFRKQFAFEKWPDFDEALYKTIREKQIERINDNPVRIYGNEINRFVIAKAEENVRNAGVEDMVQLSLGDFNDFERPSGNGVVIINPPYGEKLQPEDLEALYKSIGDRFKKHYAGYKAWIFTGSPEGAKAVGLRSNRKIKLFNGPIECRLLGYELFEGSKKDMYKDEVE